MTLTEIVAIYKIEPYKYYKPAAPNNETVKTWIVFDSHNDYFDKYLGFYRALPDFTQLIIHAVDGTFELTNKGIFYFIRHNHQKLYIKDGKQIGVDPEVLRKVRNNLLKETDNLQSATTFDELITIVSNAKEKGFGVLGIYDTAVRIGAYLGLEPTKVFLHAGTKIGMKLLEQKNYIKSGLSEDVYVEVELLPIELQEFKPIVTEHFLCSQKDKLKLLQDKKLIE